MAAPNERCARLLPPDRADLHFDQHETAGEGAGRKRRHDQLRGERDVLGRECHVLRRLSGDGLVEECRRSEYPGKEHL